MSGCCRGLPADECWARPYGCADQPPARWTAPPPEPRVFPASALRQQRQAIGLLSTADAGRVRLGGYAPTLPPR